MTARPKRNPSSSGPSPVGASRDRGEDAHRMDRPAAPLPGDVRKLDKQLLELIMQRARRIQEWANAQGLTAADVLRNQLAEIPRWSGRDIEPLSAQSARAIYRELASAAAALVVPTKAAFLGPQFSYSHLAAIERFGHGAQLTPVANIAAVFEAVQRGDVHFGVVPIENSTDGRIVDTLEMFSRMPVRICGEVQMRIHHCLLGNCSQAQIREVHSKPQALSQCRAWLAKQLPEAKLVPTTSTAAAAKRAATKQAVAAVASRQAATAYGLTVVAANIEDDADNITRFAVIGTQAARRTGEDKTSLMFELAHRPGALADAMAIFKRSRLNLTWIESYPKKGSPREYLFFVELEGHADDVRVRRAIAGLKKKAVRVDVLGCYARSQPAD